MGAQYVSFDDVKSSCSSLSALAGDFGTTIDNITSSLSNFDSAWKGDAASNFKSEFENFASKAEDAKKQIALSVLFLASVADGYDALGKDAVNKLKELIGGQSAIDSFNVDSAKEVDLNARLDENGELKTSDSTSKGIEDPSSSSNSNNSSSNNSSYSPSSGGVTYTSYTPSSSSSNNVTYTGRSNVDISKLGNPLKPTETSYKYTSADITSFLSAIVSHSNSLVNQIGNGSKSSIPEELTSTNLTAADGTYSIENFPYYNQGDYPNTSYADGTIASSGCGTTSMAMVASYLTGKVVDPETTAAWSVAHGYAGGGTSGGFFPAFSKEIGISCEEIAIDANKIVSELAEGHPIVVLVRGPGYFTNGGHYIVLTGITEDGLITIADPASRARSSVAWELATILKNGATGWTFTSDDLESRLKEAREEAIKENTSTLV